MATVEKTVGVPAPVQSTVIVPPQATRQHPPNEKACCCCPVLHGTSSHVKKARRASIFILIIHIITLLVLLNLAQLAGTVIGIVMSIVLLCKFTKCVYTAAAVLYTIGFISDALNAVFWILIYVALTDDEENSTDEELDDLSSGVVIARGAVPCVLGAVAFLLGAIFTSMAVRNWQYSGATDARLPV